MFHILYLSAVFVIISESFQLVDMCLTFSLSNNRRHQMTKTVEVFSEKENDVVEIQVADFENLYSGNEENEAVWESWVSSGWSQF